jgi:hypothetical protein
MRWEIEIEIEMEEDLVSSVGSPAAIAAVHALSHSVNLRECEEGGVECAMLKPLVPRPSPRDTTYPQQLLSQKTNRNVNSVEHVHDYDNKSLPLSMRSSHRYARDKLCTKSKTAMLAFGVSLGICFLSFGTEVLREFRTPTPINISLNNTTGGSSFSSPDLSIRNSIITESQEKMDTLTKKIGHGLRNILKPELESLPLLNVNRTDMKKDHFVSEVSHVNSNDSVSHILFIQ